MSELDALMIPKLTILRILQNLQMHKTLMLDASINMAKEAKELINVILKTLMCEQQV